MTRAGLNVHFSNLKWQLEQGKWVIEPHFLTAGFTQYIIWATKGSGFFGGTEFGHVEVDVQTSNTKAHAKLTWYNPDKGRNSCGIEITGRDARFFIGTCNINNGPLAEAHFRISSVFNSPPR